MIHGLKRNLFASSSRARAQVHCDHLHNGATVCLIPFFLFWRSPLVVEWLWFIFNPNIFGLNLRSVPNSFPTPESVKYNQIYSFELDTIKQIETKLNPANRTVDKQISSYQLVLTAVYSQSSFIRSNEKRRMNIKIFLISLIHTLNACREGICITVMFKWSF